MSDERSLQTLLRSVDNELLVLALKGADEPLREKLFSCMSKRAAANIVDEMEALGPVRLTEVQTAQKEIINVARRMSDEGTIVLVAVVVMILSDEGKLLLQNNRSSSAPT